MPVDPCLPVPLGGYTPSAPPVHRIHRIIGRIRRHGTARHVGVKRGMAPLDGCGRVPAGLPGALPGSGSAAPAAFLPKVIPAAAGGAALAGGSGVIGGFGGGGTIPSGPIGPGNPGGTSPCVGSSCSTGPGQTPVPEPASALLLGLAMLLVLMMRRPRQPAPARIRRWSRASSA
jgi:hypothetical protein